MNSGDDFFALSKTPNSPLQIDNQNGVLMSQPASERQSMLNEKVKQFVHSLRKDKEESGGQDNNQNAVKINSENESMNLGGITSQHQLVSPVHSQIKIKIPDVDGLANIRRESHISLNHQPSSESNKESMKNESHVQIYPFRSSKTMGANDKVSSMALFQSNGRMDTLGNKIQKTKGLNQVFPMSLSLRNQSNNQENSLESNLSKMVKFVKIKKKIGEMKRNVLRNGLIKKFISKAGNPFNQVLNDLVSNLPNEKNDIDTCWSLVGFLMRIFCLSSVLSLLKRIPTIEPSSKFKLVWDLMVGTSFMIFFFFIPVHIAINQPIQDLVTAQLGYVLNCIMGVDIIFSMITGYFEKGVNTSDKKKILLFYIKNYFWSDIISQIPLLVSELGSSDSQYEKIFVMCFFVKIRNFQKIFRKFEESFHLSPRVSNIISLIKLLLIILFFSHIFGCLWIYVGNNQDASSSTWLKKINLQDDDWKQQYIAAYYFSTVTMITVGYGDINPMNNLERMVSVGTMLVSCIIFAYTINQIGTIFSDLFSQDRQLKEFFYIINEYMDNKNIGFSLQYKIREYLDFYWREQDQNKSELEKKIIDSLSDQLREKLMIEANRIVLKDSGIFHHNFNSTVILKMIPLIQMIHTTPNQIIFQEGQIDDDMFIYFVEKGAIEICREFISEDGSKMSKIISTLGPGSCFGSWSFITNQERREMARSSEFSKLLLIRRSDFLDLIRENPQDIERFCFLKDSILMENNLEYLEIRCKACMSYNHEIQHCHFFHYSPDKYVIIKRNNLKYQKQNRDETFSRKSRFVQLKPTLNMPDIKSTNIHWKETQQDTIDQYKQQYLQVDHPYSDGMEYQDPYYFEGQYDQGSEEYDEEMGEDFSDDDEQGQDNEEEELDENEEDSDNNLKRKKSSSISSKNSKQSASSSTKQRRNNKFKQQGDSDAIKEEEEREGEMTASHMNIKNTLNSKVTDSKRFKSKSVSVSEDDMSQQQKSTENRHKLKATETQETHTARQNNLNISNYSEDKNQSSSSDKHSPFIKKDKLNKKQLQVASPINSDIKKQHKTKSPLNSTPRSLERRSFEKPNDTITEYTNNKKPSLKQQSYQDDYFADLAQNNQDMEEQEEEQSPQKLTLRIPSKILSRRHSIKEQQLSQEYSPQLITFNGQDNSDKELDQQPGFINSLQGEDEQMNFHYESLQYIDDFNSINNDKKQSLLSRPSPQLNQQKSSLAGVLLSPSIQQSQSSIASKNDKDIDRHLLNNNLMTYKNATNKQSIPELELNAQRLSPSVDYRGQHEENTIRQPPTLSGFSQSKTQVMPSLTETVMVPDVEENDRKQDQQQRKKSSILRRRAKQMQTGLINEVLQENDKNHLRTQQMLPQLGSVILDRSTNRGDSNEFQSRNKKIRTLTYLPNTDIPKGKKKKGNTDPELTLQVNADNLISHQSKSHPILRSGSRAKSFQNDGFKKIKNQQHQDNQDFTLKYQQQYQNRQHQVRIARTEQTTSTQQQILERKNSSESMKSSSSQAAKNQYAYSPVEVSINLGVPPSTKRKSNFALNLKDDPSKNIVQKHSSIPSNLLLKVPGDQQMLPNNTNEKQIKNKISLNSINTSINQANRSDSNHSQNNINRIDLSPTSTISLKQNFLKRNVLSIEEPLSELRKYSLGKKDPMGKRNSLSIQSPAHNTNKYNSGIIGRRSFSKLGSFAVVDSVNSQKTFVDQIKGSPKMQQQQMFSGNRMSMKTSLGIFQPSAFLERSPIGHEGSGMLVAPQILLNNTNNINSNNNSANKNNLMIQLTSPSQTQIQQSYPAAGAQNNQMYNQNAVSNNGLNMDDIADEPMNNLFQIMNFDELKNFPLYFPKSNSTKVIHKANIIINNNYMKLIKRKKNKLGNIKRNFKFEDIINQSRRPSLLLKKSTLSKKQTMHPQEYPSLRNISPPI